MTSLLLNLCNRTVERYSMKYATSLQSISKQAIILHFCFTPFPLIVEILTCFRTITVAISVSAWQQQSLIHHLAS